MLAPGLRIWGENQPPPPKKNISCRILFQRGDLDIKLQHKKSTFFLWFPQRVQVIHGFNFCGIVTCLIGQSHCLMGTLDLWWASFGKPRRSIVKSGDEFRKNYGYRMVNSKQWVNQVAVRSKHCAANLQTVTPLVHFYLAMFVYISSLISSLVVVSCVGLQWRHSSVHHLPLTKYEMFQRVCVFLSKWPRQISFVFQWNDPY